MKRSGNGREKPKSKIENRKTEEGRISNSPFRFSDFGLRHFDSLLILGIGNPLRGDDAVGWLAAERLAGTLHDPRVEVMPCHQLTPELVEPIARADTVIFIDASRTGTPGTWRMEELPPPNPAAPGPLTHHFDPPTLLAWALALHRRAPRAYALSIPGQSFGGSERLTAPVERALGEALERLSAWLRRQGVFGSRRRQNG